MAEWTTADTVQMLRNYWYGVKSAWALAVVVAFLFACVTVAHIAFLALKRRWFMIPLTLAALLEVLAYGFRAHGLHERYPELSTYVTSTTCMIIAPAFIQASLYQLLVHIHQANGNGGSYMKMKLGLGLGFGALDLLAYALQAAGAAKIQYGSLHSVPETISKLKALRSHLLAGNVINLLTLTLFLAAVIYSHIRIGRASAGEASSSGFRRLYFCLALLFIRNLYRVCSYSRGVIDLYNDDPLSLPLKIKPLWIEGFNYGFDALVAFIILVALAVWYPDHSSLDEGEDVAGPVMGGGMGKLKNLFGGKARSGANMRMEGLPGA